MQVGKTFSAGALNNISLERVKYLEPTQQCWETLKLPLFILSSLSNPLNVSILTKLKH